jgi:hypothetical protein
MNKKLIMFLLGAATGSLFTYLYFQKKEEVYEPEMGITYTEPTYGSREAYENEKVEEVVEPERKVLVMNKDRYKKVLNNYSNSPEAIEESIKPVRMLPYAITFEEFCEKFYNHDKNTITYYSKDDVLVDEDETPVEDPAWTIGSDTLDKFGVGSDDPDVVYVRNEKLAIDYEVIRIDGYYSPTEES